MITSINMETRASRFFYLYTAQGGFSQSTQGRKKKGWAVEKRE